MTKSETRNPNGATDRAAVLLVGHGTRDCDGRAEFLALAGTIRERIVGVPVAACFLELAEPTIDATVADLAQSGVRHVVVAPLLLFAAGHAKRDIPWAVEQALQKATPAGTSPPSWNQTEVLACHRELVELSAERFRQAIASVGTTATTGMSGAETSLILVGRGSRDDEATAAMHEFARLRAATIPVARTDVAFMAMAEPSYRDALHAAANRGHPRIVVQPHLLFRGQLLAELAAEVRRLAAEFPKTQWLLTEYLGPDPAIAGLVVRLCHTALAERR